MKVLIRVDASTEIGTGHVMRCLTIAEALRDQKSKVTFMMETLQGNLIEFVQAKGFQVVQEFQPADLCIIDHYGIDEVWEQSIRPFVKRIVVIDDLANRRHDCDLLLDQNIVPNYDTRYNQLVPESCGKLLGAQYLILRKEFIKERQRVYLRDGSVNRLLVFMGGSDPTNETMKVLDALKGNYIKLDHVDVVIGLSNANRTVIENICSKEDYHFHCQIDYMASLMAQADFSIGAGGSATWERCYVGVPSSSTIVAENQIIATETAASLGVVLNLGRHEKVTPDTYGKLLSSLANRKIDLQRMSEKGLKLTESSDGLNPWLEKLMELMQ